MEGGKKGGVCRGRKERSLVFFIYYHPSPPSPTSVIESRRVIMPLNFEGSEILGEFGISAGPILLLGLLVCEGEGGENPLVLYDV